MNSEATRARETNDRRDLFLSLIPLDGKAVQDYRSPRRFARTEGACSSARFWTAPVLWRFDGARETNDWRDLFLSLTPLDGKAVEDYRSPRRFARTEGACSSARFWTAPVLWRFDGARETNDWRDLFLSLTPLDGKAVEDYRSPRRFAPNEAAGNSTRLLTCHD